MKREVSKKRASGRAETPRGNGRRTSGNDRNRNSTNSRNGAGNMSRSGGDKKRQSYDDRRAQYEQYDPAFRKAETQEIEEQETNNNIIMGRNPIMEAIRAEREIDKIIITKGAEGSILKIVGMAKEKHIPIMYAEKIALDRISRGAVHQGIIAYVSSYDYVEVDDILAAAKEKAEEPFIIILDNLEDPHNFGAIMRTAEASGAHGIIIPKRRSVGITDVVVKASAGAVEYVPVAKVANIAQTIDKLKNSGLWIAACDMGDTMYYNANLSGSLALVIGSEGFGINKLVKEKCDFVVSMPMVGHITSLNASNAAAVLMYEVRRQRDAAK